MKYRTIKTGASRALPVTHEEPTTLISPMITPSRGNRAAAVFADNGPFANPTLHGPPSTDIHRDFSGTPNIRVITRQLRESEINDSPLGRPLFTPGGELPPGTVKGGGPDAARTTSDGVVQRRGSRTRRKPLSLSTFMGGNSATNLY